MAAGRPPFPWPPRSIRSRSTLLSAFMLLILLTLIGMGADYAIRTKIQDHFAIETQKTATDWIARMRPGASLDPPPSMGVLQLVDSQGRVVAANAKGAALPPLSPALPPPSDRFQFLTRCTPRDGCVMFTAVRVPPLATRLIWDGEPHAVYAGRSLPSVLAGHDLDVSIGAAVLLLTGLCTWANWVVVGRTLRPVTAIRTKMSQISVSDLSLRVPQPPGDDEIAQLARTANETLDRLDKAVGHQRHFVSVVSHEIKSPLAGLRAQLEEAMLYPDDVDARETVRSALDVTDRMQAIIDDLLAMARIGAATATAPEPVDLGALVLEEAAGTRGVPVEAHASGDLKVLGNRVQLIGVLTNLLVNAQRHAHTGVRVIAEPVDGQAVVTVLDDGDGIAPEDRERVFEPFVRLCDGHRRDPKGTGLGLAISRAIVTAHQGSLRVEDSPKGARFVVRLPLSTV